MIIHKETKSIETRNGFPNENFGGYTDVFVVDDNSELGQKILTNFPFFEFALSQSGELIDITLTERPQPTPPEPTETDILGQQLVEKDLQILELQQENQTLGQQVVDLDLRLLKGGL